MSHENENAQQTAQVHGAFKRLRRQPIESLSLVVEEYRHENTGAMHYHLAADNPENVFLVALRTVPIDSTGVAHILEHTALCGSERYPVRDPFFMMIRRSLNTFMNAFTSSDWTAYPFASQNRKDFNNLLDVYLDAVFFARLHELDFAQEGHRVEFADPQDPNSDLVFKGVVFNEMKGAMSSPISVLWQTLSEHLFPTTTYHYNSGGDPERILDLSYQQLKAFYGKHYHPSNAVFLTYGDIPAYAHQARMEEKALSQFDKLDARIEVGDETRYNAPVNVEDSYAIDDAAMTGDQTHIVIGWLLGPSTDLNELLEVHLLSGVLLNDGASPLRRALETTDLGAAPSPLCRLEDSNREMSFMCGLEGSKPENADATEMLILDVLQDVAENGVPQERVESVLHQLELSRREIGGDGFPYGLQVILNGLSTAVHRGDPVAVLNLDSALERLREAIKNPEFVKHLVRKNLLENPHRVRLTMKPDPGLAAQRDQAEARRLAAIKAAMNDADRARVMDQTTQLAARQAQEDDPEALPKVGLEDIPPDMRIAQGESDRIGTAYTTFFPQATNGLAYQQIVVELPDLDDELLELLPYYASCITKLGVGDLDYLQTQAWQSSVSGGVRAETSVRGTIDDVQNVSGHFVLSSKALAHDHAELSDLLQQTLTDVRFDEVDRIKEIIAQERARREQSVTGHGHGLAMLAATSGISPAAAMDHRLRGLLGIRRLKELDDSLSERSRLKAIAEKLNAIHRRILAAPRQFLVVGEKERRDQFKQHLADRWLSAEPKTPGAADLGFTRFALPAVRDQVKQLWKTSTQVNFCAKAFPSAPMEHADAPALGVLGGFLRNGYLHRAIREQGGAYGAGAVHDPDIAAFRFFSYRDPRLAETLEEFDRSVEWLLNEKHEQRQVEEAILGVIGANDRPASPAGEAKKTFHNALYGRSPEQRQRFRKRTLEVTLADLQRVGEIYLKPARASVAVITNNATGDELGELGFELFDL